MKLSTVLMLIGIVFALTVACNKVPDNALPVVLNIPDSRCVVFCDMPERDYRRLLAGYHEPIAGIRSEFQGDDPIGAQFGSRPRPERLTNNLDNEPLFCYAGGGHGIAGFLARKDELLFAIQRMKVLADKYSLNVSFGPPGPAQIQVATRSVGDPRKVGRYR